MAGKTRGARKEARQRLGKLRDLTVAAKTRARYEEAVRRLFQWCEVSGIDTFRTNAHLVNTIEEFVEMCWEEGEPRSYACDCLSGAQFFLPELRGKLTGAWRLCKAWQRQELPTRATPLARKAVWAMAMGRARRGQWRLAAAYLAGFEVFLRTGEILNLRRQDIILDENTGQSAVLHLGYTKSGKRRGEPESVVLREESTILALAWAIKGLEPGDRLVSESPATFRAGFATDLRKIGLSPVDYKPYSLRRGGATHKYRSGVTMGAIAEMGRWAHLATCRIYVNDAMAEVARVTLPKGTERKISGLEQELKALLAASP